MIPFPGIKYSIPHFFMSDGMHFSDASNGLFVANLQRGLQNLLGDGQVGY